MYIHVVHSIMYMYLSTSLLAEWSVLSLVLSLSTSLCRLLWIFKEISGRLSYFLHKCINVHVVLHALYIHVHVQHINASHTVSLHSVSGAGCSFPVPSSSFSFSGSLLQKEFSQAAAPDSGNVQPCTNTCKPKGESRQRKSMYMYMH